MSNTIYTIGYTGFTIDEFIATLKANKINVVIDVRSTAYSERYPNYNKSDIEKTLKQNGIYYRNYVKEFGARQDNIEYYSENDNGESYLDFEKFSKSPEFQSGVQKLTNSIEQGYAVVLMCAEKDPIKCHRTILVSRAFSKLNFNIIHLLPSSKTKNQKTIEEELIAQNCKNCYQLKIGEIPKTDEEILNEAYKKQNELIGFKLEDE